MKKYFGAVHVITTANRNRLQQEPLDVQADSLHVVPTLDYRTLANLGKKRRTHFSEEKKKGWVRWVLNVNNSFPFNLLIGEGGLLYILCGFFQAALLIRRRQITHVYSSFMPYSDHVIAWLLSLVFPKKLTWIADFRDLHVDPIYRHVVWESFQHRVWRKLLSRASLVTTVSEGLAKQLRRYHPRVHVMRNGIGHLTPIAGYERRQLNKFTIAYTGSYYEQEKPTLFLESLHHAIECNSIKEARIQFIYAGKDGATFQRLFDDAGLSSIFINEGLVSISRSFEIQRNSHLNLLLSSSSVHRTGVLSGKFYEYLAARVPILLLVSGTKDPEFSAIFQQLNCGRIFTRAESSKESLIRFITEAYQVWYEKGNLIMPQNDPELQEFKWSNNGLFLMKKLSQIQRNESSYAY